MGVFFIQIYLDQGNYKSQLYKVSEQLGLLGPFLPLLPLPDDLLEQGGQVSALLPVLLVCRPLVLGQHGLLHRALHGALQTERPLVKKMLEK